MLRHDQSDFSPSAIDGNRVARYRTEWIFAVILVSGLAAFVFQSSPAYASLRIVGNPHQGALWLQAYDQLPTCWKTDRTVCVLELPDDEMIAFITRNGGHASASRRDHRSTVNGCYQ